MSAQLLPAEVWRLIFRHATHVPSLLDTYWQHDIDDHLWAGWEAPGIDPDTDMSKALLASDEVKRAIVLVCRAWKEMGVELLYEAIQIPYDTDLNKISRLVGIMALSASGSYVGHGWWTKRISWVGNDLSNSLEDVMSLLELCHNLEIFTMTCDVAPYEAEPPLAERLQSRFSHSLRRVELWVNGPDRDSTVRLIKNMPNIPLKSLSITVSTSISHFSFYSHFHTITTLTIYVPGQLQPGLDTQWFLPNLRNLSIENFNVNDVPALLPLFERHHNTITCLHLRPTDRECDFPSLVLHTPNVRSLTFPHTHIPLLASLRDRNGGRLSPFSHITHLGILNSRMKAFVPPIGDEMERLLEVGMFPELEVVCLLYPPQPEGMEDCKQLSLMLHRRGIRLVNMRGDDSPRI